MRGARWKGPVVPSLGIGGSVPAPSRTGRGAHPTTECPALCPEAGARTASSMPAPPSVGGHACKAPRAGGAETWRRPLSSPSWDTRLQSWGSGSGCCPPSGSLEIGVTTWAGPSRRGGLSAAEDPSLGRPCVWVSSRWGVGGRCRGLGSGTGAREPTDRRPRGHRPAACPPCRPPAPVTKEGGRGAESQTHQTDWPAVSAMGGVFPAPCSLRLGLPDKTGRASPAPAGVPHDLSRPLQLAAPAAPPHLSPRFESVGRGADHAGAFGRLRAGKRQAPL